MGNKSRAIFFLLTGTLLLSSCRKTDEKPKSVAIKRDHAEISYTDSGTGGATLLFVHDIYSDKSVWEKQVSHFAQDYRVVTFDLPGHGQSGKERPFWSLRGYAGDVYSLIKRLKLKNVILVGHGTGADICLMEATYRPKNIIGFIAVESFHGSGIAPSKKERREYIRWQAINDSIALIKQQQRYLEDRFPSDTGGNRSAQYLQAVKVPASVGKDLASQTLQLHLEQRKLLPKLHVKLHVINSGAQQTKDRALRKYCKNGYELHALKGSFRYPMQEASASFNSVLQQAVESVARESKTVKKI